MLAQRYFKGQRSSTNHKILLFVSWYSQYAIIELSGHYWMRQHVPMVILVLLVYLSAVACISEEISLGPCWRKDILRVKGQALITNCSCATNMQLSSGNYLMCHQVPMMFLLLLVYLSAVACIPEEIN